MNKKRLIIVLLVTVAAVFLFMMTCGSNSSTLRDKATDIEKTQNERDESIHHKGSVYYSNHQSVNGDSFENVGLPVGGQQGLLYTRVAYTLSYDSVTKCPNWVAWHLTAEHADGDVPRINQYFEDMDVPAPRATNEDYKGSGWSRGHMCPAGDNKWSEQAMRESNLLTNICPQNASLNSGMWNSIENDCRKWAKKFGDVYIVCGPIFLNQEHETIGENRIYVPEAFFKVILCLQGTPKAIGFVVRNNEGKKKKDMFVNTVDDVERITGYDFFPALPDDTEERVESYSNQEDWK